MRKTPAIVEPVANRNGAVIIFIALALVALLALVGLAIDLGFSYGVKGQLQAAADASALVGADSIYPPNSSTPLASFPSPQWLGAKASTTSFVKENKVAGVQLTDQDIVSIRTGYWNLERKRSDLLDEGTQPKGYCSENRNRECAKSIDCLETCLMQDIPALQVTVRKSVPAMFSRVLGWELFTPAATATAAIGYPKSARGLFPVAVSKCLVDTYFAQDPMPSPPPLKTIRLPYGASAGASCDSGQWTSLNADKNDVPTMKCLMNAAQDNPPSDACVLPSLGMGDNIWIDTGAKGDLFPYIAENFSGKLIELPVVKDAALSTNGNTPIISFVYFIVQGANAPNEIRGYFAPYIKDERKSGPGGPKHNAVTHPMLVK